MQPYEVVFFVIDMKCYITQSYIVFEQVLFYYIIPYCKIFGYIMLNHITYIFIYRMLKNYMVKKNKSNKHVKYTLLTY